MAAALTGEADDEGAPGAAGAFRLAINSLGAWLLSRGVAAGACVGRCPDAGDEAPPERGALTDSSRSSDDFDSPIGGREGVCLPVVCEVDGLLDRMLLGS